MKALLEAFVECAFNMPASSLEYSFAFVVIVSQYFYLARLLFNNIMEQTCFYNQTL